MATALAARGGGRTWQQERWPSLPAAALLWCLTLVVLVFSAVDRPQRTGARTSLLSQYVAAAAQALDPRAAQTLERIQGTERQLLALRAYMRAGSALAADWTWDDAEIVRYERSNEYRRLQADLARVQRDFQRRNPGYELLANGQVRTLDVQIERWNENGSVERAATELASAVTRAIENDGTLRAVNADATQRFVEMLRRQPVATAPALAAPGLSRHGQMRAVDFAVRRGRDIVAGADSRTATRQWIAEGWSRRLHSAVVDSGAPLTGPLRNPPEPWHYDYEPDSRNARPVFRPVAR